ncbi:MAG: hypothetical protein WBG08_04430 [Litorimonas sp.]
MAVLATLAGADRAFASAWVPEPGKGEIISGYVSVDADRAIGSRGETIVLDGYGKRVTQTFATVGVRPNWALVGTFDWQTGSITQSGQTIRFSEPSSITAGLQYQISRREGHATSLSLSYVEGIDLPDALLTVENRLASIEARGYWGESRTWLGRNMFLEGQLAGRLRLSGGYDSAYTQITSGVDVTDRLLLMGKLRVAHIASGRVSGILAPRQIRRESEASAVLRVRDNDFLELSASTVLGGRNTVRERQIKLGYWRKF